MGFLAAIRVAVDALLVNRGRSVLTSLGIVIGMGFYMLALISTGVAMVALIFLDMLGTFIYPVSYRKIKVLTELDDPTEFTRKCKSILRQHRIKRSRDL